MAKVRIYHYGVGPSGSEDGPINGVGFICPGCKQVHICPTSDYKHEGNDYIWGFNNDFNKPTFTPSLLWRSGHFAQEGPPCWCTPDKEVEARPEWCYRCHSFVTDGKIQFLGDCSHALAGQTVELPDIKE